MYICTLCAFTFFHDFRPRDPKDSHGIIPDNWDRFLSPNISVYNALFSNTTGHVSNFKDGAGRVFTPKQGEQMCGLQFSYMQSKISGPQPESS